MNRTQLSNVLFRPNADINDVEDGAAPQEPPHRQGLPALAAVAAGVAAALGGAFGAEASLKRRKMALIFSEPALLAAFRANTKIWADAFGPMFARADGDPMTTLAHRAAAAAAAVLVEVCLEEWFGRDGRQDLATIIAEAFAAVGIETGTRPVSIEIGLASK